MRKVPIKNYFILLIMLVAVVLITFAGRSFYNNTLRKTSVLYKYAKHMSNNELEAYLSENSSVIIYISDKYDVNSEDSELKLKDKIIEMNLYNNFVYMDKREFSDNFLEDFNNLYHANLNIDNLPTLIIYDDGIVTAIYYSVDDNIINGIDLEGIK